ncbi:MAG: GNAT family N-acetyltransferase [Clostridia bacterium]|nr:GNAT family N-acetyltransferase [Clostridia bacterium]
MLKLRPYKCSDAETIISWCKDESSFRRWTSDRYDHFPITAADMNHKYVDCNGDCPEPDNFYPLTAVDGGEVVGHMILRYTDAAQQTLRFGFVIVDDARRGMGYGKGMIRLAQRYAFGILGAEKVTLGVFENNLPAYRCYEAAGFRKVEQEVHRSCRVGDETWRIIEFEMTKAEYATTEPPQG